MARSLKYMEIVDWTITQINTGAYQPDDKFLSEAELGSLFNCSRQTVRRALEVLVQEGRIVRRQGSSTLISSPANNIPPKEKTRLYMTIGLISTFIDNYIFPSIVRGIESVFSSKGFAVQLACTNNLVAGETKALQLMKNRQIDGLIVEPTRSALPCANLDLYHAFTRNNIPLIFIDSFYPELPLPYVAMDDVKTGYMAAKYLLNMGHRNIAGIFPHSNRQGHLRYLGYVKALAEHGIHVQEKHVYWHSKENMIQLICGDQVLESFSVCTAALCYNDWTALMLIEFLRKNGRRVPEDISVIGIDNSDLSKSHSLTTIAHPAEKLGEAAAELLHSMIYGAEGKNILLQPELVERDSVARNQK